jgi:Gamma tubulin complex component C-terminal
VLVCFCMLDWSLKSCSFEMGRHYLLLQNDNKLECHPPEAWVDVYLEVLVFHLSWKGGNIRFSSRVNTSTSFGNVGLRPAGIKVKLRMTCQWMMKSVLPNILFSFHFHFHELRCRFYKFLEDTYSHANQTLLQLLLRDQQLIPRLRSLKRYFFLSQSFFLTHMLDLSHTELRKAAKSASTVKLQSLLDLALNTDVSGDDVLFREDVKVTIAESGLYEFLLKIVNVNGVIGGEEGDAEGGHAVEERKKGKGKDEKKTMLGNSYFRFQHPNLCSQHDLQLSMPLL